MVENGGVDIIVGVFGGPVRRSEGHNMTTMRTASLLIAAGLKQLSMLRLTNMSFHLAKIAPCQQYFMTTNIRQLCDGHSREERHATDVT